MEKTKSEPDQDTQVTLVSTFEARIEPEFKPLTRDKQLKHRSTQLEVKNSISNSVRNKMFQRLGYTVALFHLSHRR